MTSSRSPGKAVADADGDAGASAPRDPIPGVADGTPTIDVTPVLEEQELPVGHGGHCREGAALVSGDAPGRAYVELTGYCDV